MKGACGSYEVPRECVCGNTHLDRATYWRHRAETSPTAQEVYDRLREEWEALGLMSYHGAPFSVEGEVMYADLSRDDIESIRALLRDAASTIEAYS